MIKALKRMLLTIILVIILITLNYLYQNPYIVEYVFARGITRYLLIGLSSISSLIPFSLAEIIVITFFIVVGYFTIVLIKSIIKLKLLKSLKLIHKFINISLMILIFASITLTVLYQRENSFAQLGLLEVQSEENPALAKEVALFYVDYLTKASAKLTRDEEGNVISPYRFDQLSQIINNEYDSLAAQNQYFTNTRIRAKSVFFSNGLSYLGILGMYFPFTGEANVNANTVSYELPSVMAHEIAHARGVIKEDEANFIAYYICLTSKDSYLNYSGAMEAINVAIGQLKGSDYDEVRALIPNEIKKEFNNANKLYYSYYGYFYELSQKVNDFYIKSSGEPSGIESYARTQPQITALYYYLKDNE